MKSEVVYNQERQKSNHDQENKPCSEHAAETAVQYGAEPPSQKGSQRAAMAQENADDRSATEASRGSIGHEATEQVINTLFMEIDQLQRTVAKQQAELEALRTPSPPPPACSCDHKIKEFALRLPKGQARIIYCLLRLLVAERCGDQLEQIRIMEEMHPEEAPPTIFTSHFRIAKRRVTDFIKIISALYDLHLFETDKGALASNKQELMNLFGQLFNLKLDNYSTLLNKAKQSNRYLDIFDRLRQKGKEYWDS